jgi:hypothetical protein
LVTDFSFAIGHFTLGKSARRCLRSVGGVCGGFSAGQRNFAGHY